MRFSLFLVFLTTLLLCMGSCTNDALPEPSEVQCVEEGLTYEEDVRPIIEETCAYSGCHLGGAPGVYNSYDGLLQDLEDGSFRDRVITQRADPNVGMPPDYAPADRAEDLTEEELTIISCWLEAGYPRE
ncbi:Maf family protein [Neolewinella agarilytica]|uniref:Cytochrome c domain-containing protein n=1 Tax=Neolewinella agarilytica TaxID=478744 RepID=A0A1H9F184_9BACT|nr:hypothetical protein [Neolewinella agarilytica]SEQ30988.1 hypothetical protein SAMN05444359_10825 [Neolewinella agarilytica]